MFRRIWLLLAWSIVVSGCQRSEPKACRLIDPAKEHIDPYTFIDMGAPVPSFGIHFFEKKEDLEKFQMKQLELLSRAADSEMSPAGLPSIDTLLIAGQLRLSSEILELSAGTKCRQFAERSEHWCKVELTDGLHKDKRGWVHCMHVVLQ